MRQRFGDIDAAGPLEFLRSRGWTQISHGRLVSPGESPPEDEVDCATFLVEEWDYVIVP